MVTATQSHVAKRIAAQPLRVLVEEYPRLMPLLTRHGLDLCCGGGRTVAEAAQLHGINPDELINDVWMVIAEEHE
jgi:iron-sulfur cluster repair protein YtfE (RIC family)